MEQFKLETSNLACRFTTRVTTTQNKNYVKEVAKKSRDLLLEFCDPSISRELYVAVGKSYIQ